MYPPPKGRRIVEPFAGSAAYSLRHCEGREVWINDLDPTTFSIWQFLTHPHALEMVHDYVPAKVKKGDRISVLIQNLHVDKPTTQPLPVGLTALMRAEAHMGTAGTSAVYDAVTSISATCWNRRLIRRLEWVIPRVRHWQVTNWHWRDIALGFDDYTVFVDPPYANAAGRAYRAHDIDYHELATWCHRQAQLRQVIVCENIGATWLPFVPLTQGRVGFNTVHKKTSVGEAICVMQPQ